MSARKLLYEETLHRRHTSLLRAIVLTYALPYFASVVVFSSVGLASRGVNGAIILGLLAFASGAAMLLPLIVRDLIFRFPWYRGRYPRRLRIFKSSLELRSPREIVVLPLTECHWELGRVSWCEDWFYVRNQRAVILTYEYCGRTYKCSCGLDGCPVEGLLSVLIDIGAIDAGNASSL